MHINDCYTKLCYREKLFFQLTIAKSTCCVILISMNLDVATLPDTPGALKDIVTRLHGEIATLRDLFTKENDILREQILLLRAQLYGRKSEKIIPEGGPQLLPLFDMPEPEDDDDEEEEVHVPAHNRKKRGRKPLPKDLPRVERIHDIDDADKICPCGCELTRIGE